MTLVSACIATYQRVPGLLALLQSIEHQRLPADVTLEIIVVDNDAPAAEEAVASMASKSRFDYLYLSQAEPNISLTRNVSVHAASGDYIWFVDDDEEADPECVGRLLDAARSFAADVVFGPVLPAFDSDVPDWLRPLYERPIHPTGHPSEAHRTSNTLVATAALRLVDGPFDADYGVTGGSDTLLFRQLEELGKRLIDSEDAFVTELVPKDRATWPWLRARMRRQGQNYARQSVALHGRAFSKPVATMTLKAIVQIGLWPACALLKWRARTDRSRYLLRMWTNVGKLEGVFGRASRRDP